MDAVEVMNSSEELKPEEEAMSEQTYVCRICLLSNPSMRDLFHNETDMLSQKVMSLANVKIMPGDGLPSHICCDCCNKLDMAYKFKLQVEQADTVLREKVDSLHIKDEFFFNHQVNANLSHHRNDVSESSQESLILKEHMALLAEKIDEEVLQTEHSKKTNVMMVGQIVETSDNKEQSQEFSQNHDEIPTQTHVEINIGQQVQIQDVPNEQNRQFETEELQDLMLSEIKDREELQEELNQVHQMALDEHNYVAESQPCETVNENSTLIAQEVKSNREIKEEEDSLNEKPEVTNVPDETQPNEATRRSQRKINQRKARANDEINYFENLNLSSRLKQVQSEKLEKVYFMCFLCDKQFLSRDVLKDHMQTHEELRKSFPNIKQTPEKTPNFPTGVSPSKLSSSGKQPNTCPHCGKEYLYVISFKKHLQQHVKDKGEVKDEMMPLEVSFREDDDTLDYQGYDDNPTDYDSYEKIKREDEESEMKGNKNTCSLLKCNVCAEVFDVVDKLKDHRIKHVVEGVLTKQDFGKVMETNILDTTDNLKEQIADSKEDIKDVKISIRRPLPSLTKYNCRVCHESFFRKDLLRKHAETHSTNLKVLRSFNCTQCNKTFNNELTLRNHLIATNHKTIIQGQEYDPNKRIKRSAAKAAQKIIDQIKNLDESEEELDKEEKDRDFEESIEISPAEDIQSNLLQGTKKTQRSSKIYSCATCNLKFPSKQTLAKHMELHSKDESSVKLEQVKSEISVRKEFDEEEEDDDDFEGGLDWPMDSHECPTCKKQYSTKKSLLRHQLLHEEPNFECDICNVKFYRKDKLKAHYDKCSEKNPDQVRKCNICGDTFENNEILREHRTKHVIEGILTEEDLQEIEPKPDDNESEKAPRKRRTDIVGLECQECNKRYTSRKGLLRHIQVHEGKKYLCDICPKKFYRREHLKLHVAKHNMIKPYKCLKCPKRFIKEEQMQNHMLKHERITKKPKESDTPKRFLCEICSKSFTQSTTLIAHLRAHNGIKPYVCEVCSRPFTTNAYLKMHMRTHTQERPYICQYCSRAFARADTLANHLTSHTGEAKYSCKYCPKHFRRLKSLKEHVFIHTGQRPYACPTCDRRFNNNGSRYAHSKRCKQNLAQSRQNNQISVQDVRVQEQEEQEEQQLQLEETQELRLQQATISQAQIIKPQNIKTIAFTRPGGTIEQPHIITNQEVYMPLIFVGGEELIALSEGAKIFTT